MPIEIEIRTIEGIDVLVVDGFNVDWNFDSIKPQHILDALVENNYITIKVTEE